MLQISINVDCYDLDIIELLNILQFYASYIIYLLLMLLFVGKLISIILNNDNDDNSSVLFSDILSIYIKQLVPASHNSLKN